MPDGSRDPAELERLRLALFAELERLGVNPKEAAERARMSPSTLYKFRKGEIRRLVPETYEALAKGLNTTAARLRGQPEAAADPDSTRVEVALPRELIDAARELGVDLSEACRAGLKEWVRTVKRQRWQEENREAIESMNEYVRLHGLPLAEFRRF